MTRVLAGSLRETLSLIARHLKGLVKASVAPLLAYSAIVAVSVFRTGDSIKILASQGVDRGGLPSGNIEDHSGFIWVTIGLGLLAWIVFVWIFVRTVRFFSEAEKFGSQILPSEAEAVFAVLVRILAIGLISLVPYFLLVAAYISLNLLVMPHSGDSDPTLLGSLTLILSFVAFVSLLVWFVSRLIVVLPAVARGAKPKFFSETWRLSNKNSIGLAARMMAVPTVYALFSGSVYFLHTMPLVAEYQTRLAQGDSNESLSIFAAEKFWRMLPLQLLGVVVVVLLVWFTSTLLHVAHRRLSAKLLA